MTSSTKWQIVDFTRQKSCYCNAQLLAVQDKVTAIHTDVFPPDEAGPFEVITINPPYSDHSAKDVIERSVWDEGNLVVRTFFARLDAYLADGGRAYLGWADFANINLIHQLSQQHGFAEQIIAERRDEHSRFVVFEIRRP